MRNEFGDEVLAAPKTGVNEFGDPIVGASAKPSFKPDAMGGALTDIASNTMDSLKGNAQATGEAMSEPWVGPNTPAALVPADMLMRGIGKLGNAIGGAGMAMASPAIGALSASVENSGVIPAAARAIKSTVPNDPRFTADITPEQQHAISMDAGNNLAGGVYAGMGALAKQGAPRAEYSPLPGAINKVEAVSEKLPGILGDTRSGRAPIESGITPELLGTGSNIRYQQMRDAGATLNPEGINLVTSSVENALKENGLMSDRRHGHTMSVINEIKEDAKTGALDLERLDLHRQSLNEVIKDNTTKLDGPNSDAMKAQAAINAIDDAVGAIEQPHLSAGTPEAIEALNQGRALYAAKAKLNTIQRIQQTAENTDNPATSMRTQFRALAKQVNTNPRGWTPEEVTAINKAAKTGLVTGALKIGGSRLISGVVGAAGGSGGGLPGALAGAVAGEAAAFPLRAGATALQSRRGDVVGQLVGQRPIVEQALPLELKEIMKLPPKEARIALQQYKKASLPKKP